MGRDPQGRAWLSMPWFPFGMFGDDRSDQKGNDNQPDAGSPMAAPGPTGGPDDNTPSHGYTPPSWMRMLGGGQPMSKGQQRNMGTMGMLGMALMQPRAPTHTGPYPWI